MLDKSNNKITKHLKNIIAVLLSTVVLTSISTAFASGNYKRNVSSIGFINKEDDGVNIGIDLTQNQQTGYKFINDDNVSNCNVYATQSSYFEVEIPETVILGGNANKDNINTGNYEVSVSGNIAGNEVVKVAPEEQFVMSSEGKPDIYVDVNQSKTTFSYNEGLRMDTAIVADGTVVATGMTAGQWHGAFDFNIELTTEDDFDYQVIEENKCGENAYYQILAPVTTDNLAMHYNLDMVETASSYDNYDVSNCKLRIYGEGSTYDYIKYIEASPWYKYRNETNIDYENRKILNPDGSDYGVSYDKYLADNPDGIHYTSIEIEQGITRIGDWCFYRCTADELVIPEGVTEIGNFGIRYSPALKKVSLPSTLKNIDDFGVSRNQVLEEVDIKEGLETVGQNAFATNLMLKSIKLPKSCTSIGVTQHPSGYTYTGVSVQNIGTFVGCKSLETIDFGSVVEIDNICCSGIAATNIVIPNTVKKIGDNAFIKCPNLETVVFEEGSQCTSIGKAAFSECTNLKSVVGGTNLETFGTSVFNKCTSLTTFEFSPTNKSVPNFYGLPITKVVLNSNVTSMGTTVAQCKQLKELYFTTNITEITNSNLAGCSALTDIYYTGTEEEFNAITITGASAIPTVNKATKHFNVPEADFYK